MNNWFYISPANSITPISQVSATSGLLRVNRKQIFLPNQLLLVYLEHH